jgi:DNA ligase 1
MRLFVETCDAVGATSKKTVKVQLVSDLLKSLSVQDAAIAAIFLTGRAFPSREERVLAVGGSQLARVVAELAEANDTDLGTAYRQHGDLGDMAEQLLRKTRDHPGGDVGLRRLAELFEQLAQTRTAAQKTALVRELFEQMSPGEVKYAIKIITGDLRIGLKESLLE